MPWYEDRVGRKRGSRHEYAFGRRGIRMNENHVRGGRGIPLDIDLIVIRRMRSDERTVPCKGLMHMQMHGSGYRLVFELFPRVNVVKRRLQESPQERSYTENDAADSHSSH
jgi:hypothetical protein